MDNKLTILITILNNNNLVKYVLTAYRSDLSYNMYNHCMDYREDYRDLLPDHIKVMGEIVDIDMNVIAGVISSNDSDRSSRHVDDFIDYGYGFDDDDTRCDNETHADYARWVLNQFRQPGVVREATDKFMKPFGLKCLYERKCYTVINASCLGDITLSGNGETYLRVSVDKCSHWIKDSV